MALMTGLGVLLLLLFGAIKADVGLNIRNTGSKWVFMKEAARSILGEAILPYLESSLNGMAIPDITGTAKTGGVKIQYSISSIQLSGFLLTLEKLNFNPEMNNGDIVVAIDGMVQMEYTYTMLTFPYSSDSGSATIMISDAKLQATVKPGRNEYYVVTFGVENTSVDMENIDIIIESDVSWLYDLLFSLFKDQIVDLLDSELSKALEEGVNEALNFFLNSKSSVTNSRVGALIDIGFTNDQGMTVHDNWLTMQMSWYAVPYEEDFRNDDRTRMESVTEVPEFPDVGNDKIYQILVSKTRVQELVVLQYSTDFLANTFEKDGEHDSCFLPAFWTNTLDLSSFSDVSEWKYSIKVSGDISMQLLPSAIRIFTNILVGFVDQNNVQRLSISAPVILSALPITSNDCLTLKQDIHQVTGITVTSGSATVIGSDFSALKELLQEVFFPYANTLLAQGGFIYTNTDLLSNVFRATNESYMIVPDSDSTDGYLLYSMDPEIVM